MNDYNELVEFFSGLGLKDPGKRKRGTHGDRAPRRSFISTTGGDDSPVEAAPLPVKPKGLKVHRVNDPRTGTTRLAEEVTESSWISPTEDLMREHGIVRRLLNLYQYAAPLFPSRKPPYEPIKEAASIFRDFVEDYHEVLEEKHVLPSLRKRGLCIELCDVIVEQHQATKKLTRQLTEALKLRNGEQVSYLLMEIGKMYGAHGAWEDTELFPVYRNALSHEELVEQGKLFDKLEHEKFGTDGFTHFLKKVQDCEKAVGIKGLNSFTYRG
jgi:hemerythrin-like domain-containing protein